MNVYAVMYSLFRKGGRTFPKQEYYGLVLSNMGGKKALENFSLE